MQTSRKSRLALLTILGALASAASSGTDALAATPRYADPGGAGTSCTSEIPCSLSEAVLSAGGGSEVIVTPGDYQLTSTLQTPAQMTIHGVAGQPRPRLRFSGANQDGLRLLAGSTLRYVEIEQAEAKSALYAEGSSVDQVIARATQSSAYGVRTALIQNSMIRNSIVVSSAINGTALLTEANGATVSGTYRNVTAIATGDGGMGIRARALGATGYATVLARNVIARGDETIGGALAVFTDNSGATATITVGYSNWLGSRILGPKSTLTDGGGNQTAAPQFVDSAGGDYRQAAGSPTIGAGLAEFINGPLDVDGDPRQVEGIDIGADEYVAPPPGSPPPSPPPPPTTPPSSPHPNSPPAFAGVGLVSSRLTLRGRFIALKLSCPAGTVGRCSGRTTLTARRRTASGAARAITLGRAPFSIASDSQGRVKVRVSSAGRRLLGRVRRLRAKDISAARDESGQSKTTVASVTIRKP